MKTMIAALVALPLMTTAAFAGDAAKGEGDFKKCKACHMIQAADGTDIVKGGKTGPNLFGVIGRGMGAYEGFKYGKGLIAAAEQGLVWDEENLAAYITDPNGFLKETLDDPKAKSKMTYKHKKGAEDMVAYLASLNG